MNVKANIELTPDSVTKLAQSLAVKHTPEELEEIQQKIYDLAGYPGRTPAWADIVSPEYKEQEARIKAIMELTSSLVAGSTALTDIAKELDDYKEENTYVGWLADEGISDSSLDARDILNMGIGIPYNVVTSEVDIVSPKDVITLANDGEHLTVMEQRREIPITATKAELRNKVTVVPNLRMIQPMLQFHEDMLEHIKIYINASLTRW